MALSKAQRRLAADLESGWLESNWSSHRLRFDDGRRGRVVNYRTVEAIRLAFGLVEMRVQSIRHKIPKTTLSLPGKEHLVLKRYELVRRVTG